jgi:putative transposase
MARLARVVIPGHPHHVTQRGNGQRGNGRARTFFDDGDYALYRDLLSTGNRGSVKPGSDCMSKNCGQ